MNRLSIGAGLVGPQHVGNPNDPAVSCDSPARASTLGVVQRQLAELPEWLTCAQVATLTQLSERSLDRAISTGRLEVAKTNGSVRIHRSAVRAWLVPSPGR